ncbi:hypothetical protein [Salinactinospora qingdaonensis]|uniref:Uncharacterized protein n=1 Tax=Salinactinospora qingdaonensis TaxID=702744 RepID=A0ABP7FBG6_9ACTN
MEPWHSKEQKPAARGVSTLDALDVLDRVSATATADLDVYMANPGVPHHPQIVEKRPRRLRVGLSGQKFSDLGLTTSPNRPFDKHIRGEQTPDQPGNAHPHRLTFGSCSPVADRPRRSP